MNQQQTPPDYSALARGVQQASQPQQQQPSHPMKKQLLQYLLNIYMKSQHPTVDMAVQGMKGLMGAYNNIGKEIDGWLPANTVDYQRPSAPPAYNPMGGNSAATMAQHYPGGFSANTPSPSQPSQPLPGANTGQSMEGMMR